MANPFKDAMAAGAKLTPYEKFRNHLYQLKPDLAALVGDKVDRFMQVALNAVSANQDLLSADARSLLAACKRAAQDGLLPDGREAVFNIYNTKIKREGREEWVKIVQYLPMVGGLIKKLYDSGHVRFVDAVAVYQRDVFDYQRGDDPKIVHKPYAGADEPGAIVAAYAIVRLSNGEVKREVMFKRDLDKVRNAAKTDKVWLEWEDQMAIKSVLKRAYKQLPSTIEIDSVVEADNAAMNFSVGTDLALLPESAGGEPVPAGVSTVGKDRTRDPVPAQAKPETDDKRDARPVEGQAGAPTDEPPIPMSERMATRIMKADGLDVLDLVADEIRTMVELSDDEKAALSSLIGSRRNQLTTPPVGKKGKS